jgi:hypothetical protein
LELALCQTAILFKSTQALYAICAEIGERLLEQRGQSIPPGLPKLVERLPELDQHDAPSIAALNATGTTRRFE